MYIARQPIFKTNLDVYGYELLYRSDETTRVFDGTDATRATAGVLASLYEAGIEEITNRKKAFINFDAHFLHEDLPDFIATDEMVIEVLEDVIVDEALIERIKFLKSKGYRIALDDFVEDFATYPLVPYADIIKFDLLLTPLDTIRTQVVAALMQKKILLAEKIETEEVFDKAKAMGFTLFQGYFFSKPVVMKKSASKLNSKSQYLNILNELKQEEPSYQVMAEIIEKDVNLAYRLMRVIKSRSGDDLVYSIKRALTYMGLREIERWVSILMVQDLGSDKPKELTTLSLVRSKFAESIGVHSNLKRVKHEISMMGLFSTIDAMLNQPMADALVDIALPKNIKLALCDHSGPLYPIYALMLAYEQADFDTAATEAKKINIPTYALMTDYLEAVKWANEMTSMIT
ncbi:MAG: hypothetical protein PWP51_1112 [Clostridiales bacterium]|jgi:EAL and modified HD-GYP domain-containing signal transduction protein|nr:hypothetical protein [Clostridiales bacterium]MDN5298559.1 hypothetical protein [Clostridiales bacterium]